MLYNLHLRDITYCRCWRLQRCCRCRRLQRCCRCRLYSRRRRNCFRRSEGLVREGPRTSSWKQTRYFFLFLLFPKINILIWSYLALLLSFKPWAKKSLRSLIWQKWPQTSMKCKRNLNFHILNYFNIEVILSFIVLFILSSF